MTDGMTCYERDEALCEDQMCLRVGCRIRNERLSPPSSSQPKGETLRHTPTPWRVFTNPDGTKLVGVGGQDGVGILDCGFGVWSWSDPEGIANANLVVEAVNSHATLTARVEELEANERAYEAALGQRTYNEIATQIAELLAIQPREAFADEIKRADAAPPEASFDNASDMLEYLDAPRKAEPVTERMAFIRAYPHLDLTEVPDAWGRPMFKHSHVQALWDGWFARAVLASPSPIPEAPVGREEIVEAEKALAACLGCMSRNTIAYAMATDALKSIRALKPKDGGESGR